MRPATRAIYTNAVETHLRPRWGRTRLDAITGDDVAALVRDLRADGAAEWSIRGILGALGRVYRHASNRLGWLGTNPTTLLGNGERPKTSATARRRIYEGDELAQTSPRRREPTRTLFALAAVTGARLSELLGLTWADLDLGDINAAAVRIEAQVDRSGERQPLKTAESRRTIEIPSSLAAALKRHQLASGVPGRTAFVFATRSGRPLGQRNVLRALREAQARAVDGEAVRPSPRLSRRWRPVRRSRATRRPTSMASATAPPASRSPTGRAPRKCPGSSDTRTAWSPAPSTSRSSARSSDRRDGGRAWRRSTPMRSLALRGPSARGRVGNNSHAKSMTAATRAGLTG